MGADDVRLDAVAWVKARRSQFFPSGVPESIYLAAYLMVDAMLLGGGQCTISKADDWWVVGSDVDWLQTEACAPQDLFRRVVAAPTHGQHSMRGEVIVFAF